MGLVKRLYAHVFDWLFNLDEFLCYNTYMKKYWALLTRSHRDELYNPLTYPFLISTFAYGIGFLFFSHTDDVGKSSLFAAMTLIHPSAPQLWGLVAVVTIVMGLVFLLFNKPPYGRYSGLLGFMVWVFACFCWVLTGAILVACAVGVPNLIFWFWQFLSLSRFHREDVEDGYKNKRS